MMNLLFARFVSMEDGRTILARRDAIAAAKAETEVLAAAPTTEPKGTQGPRGPRAVVVAGPSGVGKGTLISMLMEDMRGKFGFSVSHATRVSRPGEVDGVNYHFVAVPEMEAAIKNGEFIEYAKVHGNYYGTSKKSVADVCEQGKVCILDIDVQGVKSVHKAWSSEPVRITCVPFGSVRRFITLWLSVRSGRSSCSSSQRRKRCSRLVYVVVGQRTIYRWQDVWLQRRQNWPSRQAWRAGKFSPRRL